MFNGDATITRSGCNEVSIGMPASCRTCAAHRRIVDCPDRADTVGAIDGCRVVYRHVRRHLLDRGKLRQARGRRPPERSAGSRAAIAAEGAWLARRPAGQGRSRRRGACSSAHRSRIGLSDAGGMTSDDSADMPTWTCAASVAQRHCGLVSTKVQRQDARPAKLQYGVDGASMRRRMDAYAGARLLMRSSSKRSYPDHAVAGAPVSPLLRRMIAHFGVGQRVASQAVTTDAAARYRQRGSAAPRSAVRCAIDDPAFGAECHPAEGCAGTRGPAIEHRRHAYRPARAGGVPRCLNCQRGGRPDLRVIGSRLPPTSDAPHGRALQNIRYGLGCAW